MDSMIVGTVHGTFVLEVGKEYVITPTNPRKKHNRGRHCIILAFVPYHEYKPADIVAKVRFTDNNRVGRSELGELVPVGDSVAS